MIRSGADVHQQLEEFGFATLPNIIPPDELEILRATFGNSHAQRNLLQVPTVHRLAWSSRILSAISDVFHSSCFPIRATLFNKTSDANWKVNWHQDAVVPVARREEVPGWGPWTMKDRVPHVRPPAVVLANILAVRIHLDDCSADNGALKIVPGSHKLGLLPDRDIAFLPKSNITVCDMNAGDILLMRPLLLHSSSASETPSSRRIIHIEYAASELPPPLSWYARERRSEVHTHS